MERLDSLRLAHSARYLYENSLVTLPDGLFEGCHSLKIV